MERILITILFFIIGVVFGSFYNVVGHRLSLNKSIIKPRSYCPNCKTTLKTKDLIPIFSFIFLKGRCRYCHHKISIFYPIIELITGILFAVSFYSFGFSWNLGLSLLLVSLFSIIIVSDLNYYIIPDEIIIVFSILIFIVNIFNYGIVEALKYGLYGIIMFVTMLLIMELGNLLFKQESMGGGDIKLMFVLGMSLPLILSFVGIVLGTLLAFPLATYLLLKHKDKVLPFGPFLVAGFLILIMFKIDINDVRIFINNLIQ